jgi:hypothetical protein
MRSASCFSAVSCAGKLHLAPEPLPHRRERPVEYIFFSNVDRTFVVEALRAAGDRFEYLAHTSDESLFEHYEIKRAACLRLAGDIDADK